MKSPYKVKHWSPVKRVPKAYDPYWNVIEWENIEADEYGEKERAGLIIGNGIWDWMKPPEPVILKVEDLYENFPPEDWSMLDALFEDRPDLHDRIEKYKEEHKRG